MNLGVFLTCWIEMLYKHYFSFGLFADDSLLFPLLQMRQLLGDFQCAHSLPAWIMLQSPLATSCRNRAQESGLREGEPESQTRFSRCFFDKYTRPKSGLTGLRRRLCKCPDARELGEPGTNSEEGE